MISSNFYSNLDPETSHLCFIPHQLPSLSDSTSTGACAQHAFPANTIHHKTVAMQSRFQSSLATARESDYAKSTSSFFGNILTTTTSKYNTLKRQLISSEADGDTEDDSHIARGLRAYYTEKGRQFPEWLPKDPKAPVQAPPQVMVSSYGQGQQGGQNVLQQGQGGLQRRPGGGLSDLWGDQRNSAPPPATESLRARPGMMQSNSSGSAPQAQSAGGGRFGNRLGLGGNDGASQQETQSRPLPSQRAGSYQSVGAASGGSGRFDTSSPPPSAGTGTAQDRLKARLWGGRTASPPPSNSSTPSVASSGSRNPYESMGSSGGGNPYANQGSGGSGRSGGGNPYANQGAPRMGANSPWSGGGDDYGGGGGGYDQGSQRGGGLPSGPRAGRQGVGLPSGPRPQRF